MIKKTKIRSDFKLLISGNPDDRINYLLEVEDAPYQEIKPDITNMPKAADLFITAVDAQIIEPTITPAESVIHPTDGGVFDNKEEFTIDVSTAEVTENNSFFTSDELARMDNENIPTVESAEDVKQKLEKGKELRKKANM